MTVCSKRASFLAGSMAVLPGKISGAAIGADEVIVTGAVKEDSRDARFIPRFFPRCFQDECGARVARLWSNRRSPQFPSRTGAPPGATEDSGEAASDGCGPPYRCERADLFCLQRNTAPTGR